MIKDKEQRRISRKMGRISGKTRKGGLSTVTIIKNGKKYTNQKNVRL